MVAAVAISRMTLNDFEHLASSDGLELIHGVPTEMPPVSIESSWLAGATYYRAQVSLDQSKAGILFPPDQVIACWPDDPDHGRKPDMVFVRKSRLIPGPKRRGAITIVPDLVVEVVSPHDEAGGLQAKLADYRRARIPVVWVIYPETRDAFVHRASTNEAVYVPPAGTLEGEGLLPGFRLSLAELFQAADEALGS